MTVQRPDEDRRNYPRDYLMGRLAVMLGGRAAEDLVFGQPTTGAESDLKAATQPGTAHGRAVGDDRRSRARVLRGGRDQPFLGRELAAPRDYAEATAARIDQEVVAIITTARDKATAILRTARPALDALAEDLVAHEMVDRTRRDPDAGGLHPGQRRTCRIGCRRGQRGRVARAVAPCREGIWPIRSGRVLTRRAREPQPGGVNVDSAAISVAAALLAT